MLRYEDLVEDLAGWMAWLAGKLRVGVDRLAAGPRGRRELRLDARRRGRNCTPDRRGVLKDPAASSRGRPGAGREVLAPADVAAYEERVRRLVAEEAPAEPDEVLLAAGSACG